MSPNVTDVYMKFFSTNFSFFESIFKPKTYLRSPLSYITLLDWPTSSRFEFRKHFIDKFCFD